jgi:hypothetical protein
MTQSVISRLVSVVKYFVFKSLIWAAYLVMRVMYKCLNMNKGLK